MKFTEFLGLAIFLTLWQECWESASTALVITAVANIGVVLVDWVCERWLKK